MSPHKITDPFKNFASPFSFFLYKAAWQKQRDEFEYYRTYGYECYSKYGNTYYKKYDTWYTQRPFMASDLLAYYKCTCEGGETGRYTCIPDSVPCFSQATKNTYDVNESWDWHRTISFGIGKQVEDLYECHCEGGPTGKYKCSEKVQGCIDARYNMMKYQINWTGFFVFFLKQRI